MNKQNIKKYIRKALSQSSSDAFSFESPACTYRIGLSVQYPRYNISVTRNGIPVAFCSWPFYETRQPRVADINWLSDQFDRQYLLNRLKKYLWATCHHRSVTISKQWSDNLYSLYLSEIGNPKGGTIDAVPLAAALDWLEGFSRQAIIDRYHSGEMK